MAAPGTYIITQSNPLPRGVVTSTGTWFVVGSAQKGPTTQAQLIRNMTEFQTYFGSRQSSSLLWDALETFFREGGLRAYVTRTVGPSAVAASKTLQDASAGNSLLVTAKNAGTWGNNLSVAVDIVSGTYRITITDSVLGQVDQSPYMATQAEALQWSLASNWVTVTLPGSPSTLIPAALSATALTSGVDDYAGVTDTIRQNALANFPASLGPGQVSMPGNTTAGNRTALIAHARANNRQAFLDSVNSTARSTLQTEGQGLQGDEYGALFTPWLIAPGVVPNNTRTVPPCALAAALVARLDATFSPNEPAAGDNGRARWVVDVAATFNDSDRDLLNQAGVDLFRSLGGSVVLFGYRTLANPAVDTTWLNLANQRLRMAIIQQLKQAAHAFTFDQIDGRGLKQAEFQGALTGVLMPFYNDGSLYGATPGEAFAVDTGSSVNTPSTLAAMELDAAVEVRMSPMAERVNIGIVKVPVNQSL